MVGFAGLSLEASIKLRQSQIVDRGTAITYESRRFGGLRHKFLSREAAQILAEWLGNAEFCDRVPVSPTGDRWVIPGNAGVGPWNRDSNPPENPLGYLEAACRAEGIARMTFEDIHVLHTKYKFTGPSGLFELGIALGGRRAMSTRFDIDHRAENALAPRKSGMRLNAPAAPRHQIAHRKA